MKVSELIKSLEEMKETYGDLDVTLSLITPIQKNFKGEDVMESKVIFVSYMQMEEKDEINLRSFPY